MKAPVLGGGVNVIALVFHLRVVGSSQDGRDRDQPGGSFLLYLETLAFWPGLTRTQRDLLLWKAGQKGWNQKREDLKECHPCHLPLCSYSSLIMETE